MPTGLFPCVAPTETPFTYRRPRRVMVLGAGGLGSPGRSTCRRGDLVSQRCEEPDAWSQASFERNEGENAYRHTRASTSELERKLAEALEQQTATSEVLQVISSSPGELQPVFEAMLANAVRICEAGFGTLLLSEGDVFRVARYTVPRRHWTNCCGATR